MDSTQKTCAKCHKTQAEVSLPLKRCAKCQNQWYCSRDCQKADWKSHKAFCASSQQTNAQNKPQATTNFDAMPKVAGDFFKGICPDNYLHRFSEKDAFCQLIDCYRMRVEDDYTFAGDTRGLYNEDDPLPDFQEFLDMAEMKNGILPSWWSDGKRRECEERAVDARQWSDLNCAVEKRDIIKHYGDGSMPMKLRLLAEKIYGKKIEGT
ncbi:MAG: hypothetical protein ASARMPREDX12_008386 [Alectoria sarmentosa]|nr:MAG: hypothetical protein ASARMPREDX12_008386 [Alectoria sarmentosa]